MVYSPSTLITMASRIPTDVVFFAVGFETTARQTHGGLPGKAEGIRNFSILCSHVLVPRMDAILSSPANAYRVSRGRTRMHRHGI